MLDIEDAFGIRIRYHEEMDGFASVGDLVACVRSHLAARGVRRASAPRPSSPWTSTLAGRR